MGRGGVGMNAKQEPLPLHPRLFEEADLCMRNIWGMAGEAVSDSQSTELHTIMCLPTAFSASANLGLLIPDGDPENRFPT